MKAFVFPGQGSQAVGMGQALADAFPEARATFDEADAALVSGAADEVLPLEHNPATVWSLEPCHHA